MAPRKPPVLAAASGELPENLQPAVDHAIIGGEGDAEVGVAATEDVSWNDQEVLADRRLDEFGVVPQGTRGNA